MAYNMLIAFEDSPGNPIFDKYLGSANYIDTYWEAVGRKLSLPIVSSITERADSEEGFVIEKDELLSFRHEITKLEEFWKYQDTDIATPEDFYDDLGEIKVGIDNAIVKGLKLLIG